MDEAERLRGAAERAQLLANLRPLLPEIDQLAAGGFDGSDRQRLLVQYMARVLQAELQLRASDLHEPS